MKALASLLVVVVAAAFVAALFVVSPLGVLRRPDEQPAQRAQAEREAARARGERQRVQEQSEELAEQRRERLTLLTATLGLPPVTRLSRAETTLFQEAGRKRARTVAASERRSVVRLREPVQIDEWTVLQAGTAVEFIHWQRDDVATVRHDGARYEVAAHQITEP